MLEALSSDRDVVCGVVEGGFTVWEGTRHLLSYLQRTRSPPPVFEGKRVLDLGCGAGLLGLYALLHGASHVTFQVSPLLWFTKPGWWHCRSIIWWVINPERLCDWSTSGQ